MRSIPNNSDNCDIKFNLDDNLPLKKILELYNMIKNVRSIFLE